MQTYEELYGTSSTKRMSWLSKKCVIVIFAHLLHKTDTVRQHCAFTVHISVPCTLLLGTTCKSPDDPLHRWYCNSVQ